MEVLSRILAKKVEESAQFRFHWRCRKNKLTHLCFADDLLVFCRGDVASTSVIKETLGLFSDLSGLQPNPTKSEIFLSGVDDVSQGGIVSTLGYSVGSLPVRYLGVPLISTKLRAMDCRVLEERLISKVRSWTNKFLSFAGRLQLIQAVLFNIQSYWCSHFILPTKVYKSIEGILRAFLWKGTSLDKHGAKVAWDEVARPKEEGGLGIKRIKEWNMACMTKFIWQICLPGCKSLWVTWVKLNLLQKSHFWMAKVPGNCSWTWRKILKLRDRVRPFIRFQVGNGNDISLWFDSWMPRGPICRSSSDRVIYDSGLPRDALVSRIIVDGCWHWPLANSNELLDLKRETEDLPLPHALASDKLVWVDNGRWNFSVKQVWQSLRARVDVVPWFKVIWFKYNVPRHSFVLWLASKKRLPTQDRLLSFGLLSRMSCLFCRDPYEDHDHLFFRCTFTSRIWQSLLAKCGLQDSSNSWLEVLDWTLISFRGSSLRSVIGKISLAATVYTIWMERNRRLHDNLYLDVVTLLRSIQSLVRLRLMSASKFPDSLANRHLIQQWHLHESILM